MMFKFVTKLCGYGLLALFLIEILCIVFTNNIRTSNKMGIYPRFFGQQTINNRSLKTFKSDTAWLGGSVSRQIIPKAENVFTSHAGMLVQGNFVLLKNIIDNNPQLKVVTYGMSPMTFSFGFQEKGTSLSFLKPYQSIYKYADIDVQTLRYMTNKPISFIYLFTFGKFLPFDDIDFSVRNAYRRNLDTDCFNYLQKMKNLCDKKGIEFVIYCPPINQKRIDITNDFQEVKGRVYKTPLQSLFERYFRTVFVMDDSYFRDGQHFHNNIIAKERDYVTNLIRNKIAESKNKINDKPK